MARRQRATTASPSTHSVSGDQYHPRVSLPRDQVLEQIDTLLAEYERAQHASPHDDLSGGIPDDALGAIKTRMLAAIHRIAPGDNSYTRATRDLPKGHMDFAGFAVIVLAGVLRGLRADVEAGYTQTLEELVHADLFSDFLEMAEELQRSGYKDAAAVLAGSTLEEHLRKLARKNGIAVEKPDGAPKKADTLNADLAGGSVYNKLEQKSVTAWLDLRNSAAHGKYDGYDHRQAASLIQGVRDFMMRHPA